MKIKQTLIITGIILFIILAGGLVFSAYKLAAVDLASRPSVRFIEPLSGQTLMKRDFLVHAIARDKTGIEQVQLWVDGEPYAFEKSSLPEGARIFPLVTMWQPGEAGRHVLTVRAYNQGGHEAIGSVVVEISEEEGDIRAQEYATGAEPATEGEEKESIDVPVREGGSALIPESAEKEGENIPLIDERILIEPLEGLASQPVRSLLGILRGIFQPDWTPLSGGTLLQVEGLYLETDLTYDGVFCYLALGDSPVERIPADDASYIRAGPENYWDIQSLLGRENSRTVQLGAGEDSLRVMLNCWGAVFEAGGVYDLGKLEATHPTSDWDGHTIDQSVSGPSGWFRAGYRIQPVSDTTETLPAPRLAHTCWETPYDRYCSLHWEYQEDARERIDGFMLMRDGTLVLQGWDPDQRFWILFGMHGNLPTCGRTSTYQVVAYQDGGALGAQSPPSNTVSISSEPCYMVQVRFEDVYLFCLEGDGSRNYCNEDNCWEHEQDWGSLPPEGQFDICVKNALYGDESISAEYYDFMGCSYGTMWANEEKVRIGEWTGTFGFCVEMAGGARYAVAEYAQGGADTVIVPLEGGEPLTVGMNWYDMDSNADDLQCRGEIVYSPADLAEIARMPRASQTVRRTFCDAGGGMCGLQYTIQAIQLTPPSK